VNLAPGTPLAKYPLWGGRFPFFPVSVSSHFPNQAHSSKNRVDHPDTLPLERGHDPAGDFVGVIARFMVRPFCLLYMQLSAQEKRAS
jgi:hypothetical protein